jgi:septum formation protein
VTLRFVLASASPARLETLTRAGVRPEVIVSAVDEDALAGSLPGIGTGELTAALALAKAHAVARELRGSALVLGCDSMLDLDGVALGKPGSVEAAAARWRSMRGRPGVLHTGHCLVSVVDGVVAAEAADIASTTVHFADISDAEIDLYCATGEPAHVAGAFTVDGLGGWFVERVEGDHHNVVGVSLPLLRRLLSKLGYTLADVGYPGG